MRLQAQQLHEEQQAICWMSMLQAHLRPRTNTIGAVARIRNALAYATHSFFQVRDSPPRAQRVYT
jgi:aspartyl/asparaginyl-tRNA synthetase